MRRSAKTSFADRLLAPPQDGETLRLEDGSRVAVIGGGPAGSFFAYFLLVAAEVVDLEVEVDIYEARSFKRCGPGGCNHCGGIVSESLVQILATEGINLPSTVVQRAIESYVVHMDVGSVSIPSPVGERRIASLYRGNGPRTAESQAWNSFDDHLQCMAVERGARVLRKLVTGLEWVDGFPHVTEPAGEPVRYDLVAVASGVNSNFLASLNGDSGIKGLPETTRTYITEFRSDHAEIERVMGQAMHVFLLDIPRLEFAALIPKGEFVTLALLGEDVDQELVRTFLNAPEVRRCLPVDSIPSVCTCSPLINVRGMREPFADRLVMVGDAGVTRLYKDGIGAAFRTSKAAATAAVFEGISAEAFRRRYLPACRRIVRDNGVGRFIFAFTTLVKRYQFARRGILRMTRKDRLEKGDHGRMSPVLWNLFTGSAPYKDIFFDTLHPVFIARLLWNLFVAVLPMRNRRQAT